MSQMKARQSSKIRELGEALVSAGFVGLDEQAKSLGISRSTVGVAERPGRKGSGLTASVVNRILASPCLPPLVRAKTIEYVEEKVAGLHGHNKHQLRRFVAHLASAEAEATVPSHIWPTLSRCETRAEQKVNQGLDDD
jgi:hypothetical protein